MPLPALGDTQQAHQKFVSAFTSFLASLTRKVHRFFTLKEYRKYLVLTGIFVLLFISISTIFIAQTLKRRKDITPLPSLAAENLVPNPSFEDDTDTDGVPDGWVGEWSPISEAPAPAIVTIPPAAGSTNLSWGGFYVPASSIASYGMTGNITEQLNSPSQIISALREARQGSYRLIVTVGSVSECAHPINGTQASVDAAYAYFSDILSFSTSQMEELRGFIADGTLQAFRFYDEVHNAACGSIKSYLKTCNSSGQIVTFPNDQHPQQLDIMPPGQDGAPGFGDLLYRLLEDLPEGVVVGSTTGPSYMIMVAERINQLRGAGNPLPPNSILAYRGAPTDIRSGGHPEAYRTFFECAANDHEGSEYLYFLANKSAQYGSDNYDFFADYIAMCRVPGVDFAASWDWNRGSPNFASRMSDLADGGVSRGGNTITLSDVRNACSR